ATPRTATVSFEVGIAPLTGDSAMPLLIYSVVYFAIVILVSLYTFRAGEFITHNVSGKQHNKAAAVIRQRNAHQRQAERFCALLV
ncbi:branched-chain amino acid transport system II carrier protein, partial [Salmonella enterica subsp. enterica serovar Montevideo]|nr:branched-chain amino acid transport system II carrier protein [Salmonella enterica subsp. enterica serovar Montevideo]